MLKYAALALLGTVVPAVAQEPPKRVYETDQCTMRSCTKITLQLIPTDHDASVTGKIEQRLYGHLDCHRLTGVADDSGNVTLLVWPRVEGVQDGHAEVMMSKDRDRFEAVIYDRQGFSHQDTFHLIREEN